MPNLEEITLGINVFSGSQETILESTKESIPYCFIDLLSLRTIRLGEYAFFGSRYSTLKMLSEFNIKKTGDE